MQVTNNLRLLLQLVDVGYRFVGGGEKRRVRLLNIPVRRAGSRRPIGHLANIGRGSSLDERDAPEGGDFVSPPFEDWGLGCRDLRRSCVVDSHLLLAEN